MALKLTKEVQQLFGLDAAWGMVRRYVRWFIFGVVGFMLLSIAVTVILVVGLFQLLVRPVINQTPSATSDSWQTETQRLNQKIDTLEQRLEAMEAYRLSSPTPATR